MECSSLGDKATWQLLQRYLPLNCSPVGGLNPEVLLHITRNEIQAVQLNGKS